MNKGYCVFCDKVVIRIKAGNGGSGHLSFLHEKYREYGGPDGGDGGNGGNVIFRVNPSWNTLYFYKTNRFLSAENGEEGKKLRKHGRNGQDLVVDVPAGTMVFDNENNKVLADLDELQSEAVIARGGEGGFGNAHFTSSTRQTPQFAEKGTEGEEFELRLELKLVADVALVGLPNIGKSTLLSVISAAKPKIADYEFTTLTPNLGVVEGYDTPGFIVADLPGLIEGAAQGKGLGDEFLRHIERSRVVVHLVDGFSDDIAGDFEKINKEIREFNPKILKKPQILVISRIDILSDDVWKKKEKEAQAIIDKHKAIFKFDKKPFLISAQTHLGLDQLVREISAELDKLPKKIEKAEQKVYTIADVEEKLNPVITKTDEGFTVVSPRLEKFVVKTDFKNPHAVARIYDIMTRMGIVKQLEKMGAHFGDKIKLLDNEIDFKG
jgi:GTP-binding protein